jgi:hypothetical protein
MIYTVDDTKYLDYIHACGEILGIQDSLTDITIEFKTKCDYDAGGFCHGDTDDVEIEIATHVQGEELPDEDVMRNIAHEMIHAQQIIDGRLENVGLQLLQSGDSQSLVNVVVWDKERYVNTPYADQPWEIDAYSREERVMNEALSNV